MDFARHEAELNTPNDEGVTLRAIYEEKERKGEKVPSDSPECPEELAYLYGFATDLTGRSGAHQYGLAPLTYSTIRDWSQLSGWEVGPREVEALLRLDTIMRNGGSKKEEAKPDAPLEIPAWPTKKESVS